MQRNRGITLIELMITLAILSLLITIGTPSLLNLKAHLTHRSANQSFEHFLNSARNQAISLGMPVRIVFDNQAWCLGATVQATCDCNSAGSCQLSGSDVTLQQHQFPGISLDKITFSKAQLTQFSPRLGTAFGYNGSFELTSQIASVRIVVSALGRTRYCLVSGHLSGVEAC